MKNSVILKKKDKLTLKQEKFCNFYISDDFYGNGTGAYLKVYGAWYKKKYGKVLKEKSARESASRLLRSVNICQRIAGLLDNAGFNDENVDKQHLFLINQHAELNTKLGAIKEYNTVKKRVNNPGPNQINIHFDVKQRDTIAAEVIRRSSRTNDNSGSEGTPIELLRGD